MLEVVDAMLERLAAAEHHGGGGAHAELVSGAMNVQPIFGPALEARDFEADFVIEDLGAAARNGIEPGIAQTLDGLFDGERAQVGEVQDLAGGEAVQMDLRKAVFDAAQQL